MAVRMSIAEIMRNRKYSVTLAVVYLVRFLGSLHQSHVNSDLTILKILPYIA
jgi:hypothetical protein